MSEDLPIIPQDEQQQIATQVPEQQEAAARDLMGPTREAEQAFQEQVPSHIVEDDERFSRTVYDLGEGVSITFRGREELPTFTKSDGDQKVTRGIIGVDERPQHTSGDRFGEWVMDMTDGEPSEDVFERAAQQGSDRVELIATATPHGMVNAAIELIKIGRGDPGNLERLEQIRDTLRDGKISDDVLKVYDEIMIAATVDPDSPNMLGFTIEEGQPGKLDTDAPMIVAMSLAGDPVATALIRAKEAKLATMEAVHEQIQREHEGRTPDDAEMKEPGQLLSAEDQEVIAEGHFVAVHTTDANPVEVSPGLRVLQPAAEFDKKNPTHSQRRTLHWSLNHPVISHIGGGFNSRDYTIVSPLEELTKVNGAPGVMYGVDTYFVSNPGEGMMLTDKAKVIHTHEDPSKPFITTDGPQIELKVGNLTSSDIEQCVDFLTNDYLVRLKDQGWEESTARYAARHTMAEMLTTHPHTIFNDIQKLTLSDEEKAGMQPYDREITPYSQEIFRALHGQGMDLDEMAGRIKAGESQAYKDLEEAMKAAAEHIIESGEIDKYPELQKELGEEMRRRVIDITIMQMGGKVVRSDGMSAYVEDPQFQDSVENVCRKVGLRSGLHQYQPESRAEEVIDEEVGKAITTEPVPEDLQDTAGVRRARADFDWTKYDGRDPWAIMAGSRVPWAVRRQLIASGMLEFDDRGPDPNDEGNWF